MSEPRRSQEVLQELFEQAERLCDDASIPALTLRLAQYRLIVSTLEPAAPLPESAAAGAPEAAGVEQSEAPRASADEPSSLGTQVVLAREQAEAALRGAAISATSETTHGRVTRLATGFVTVLTLLVLTGPRLASWFAPVDLAKGKPWVASSTLFPCFPERVDCGGARTTIFFHTEEENEPWVRFDLGAPTSFSAVTVVNRRDAARERAVPLVLEVSDDDASWRLVARRDDDFSVWNARFATTTARYVRLKVPRRTYLHLDEVRIHP